MSIDFNNQLQNLDERFQQKAVEMANEIYQRQDVTKDQAIRKGIAMAKEWWMSVGG